MYSLTLTFNFSRYIESNMKANFNSFSDPNILYNKIGKSTCPFLIKIK